MVQALAMSRFTPFSALAALILISACSQISPEAAPRPAQDAPAVDAVGSTDSEAEVEVEAEAETEVEEAEAPAATGSQRLGEVTASLGDPSVPGAWISTSLVSSAQPGRIEAPSTGQSANVELRPSDDAATLSPAAMQALGLSLADIPTVVVYTR